MDNMSPDEVQTLMTDLPRVRHWIEQNPWARAEVAVDRSAFESGSGHVLLVVGIHRREHVDRARRNLIAIVTQPDRLRVKAWRPSASDAERIQRAILDHPPDSDRGTHVTTVGIDAEGFVIVTLNQSDHDYAAQLSSAYGHGLRISPEPSTAEFPPSNVPRAR